MAITSDIPMKEMIYAIIISMRIQFLVLALVCVWLGVAVARYTGVALFWGDVLVAFAGGFLAHAAVNLLNDYHDARSGLDDRTHRTPFSGGSGALQRFPAQQKGILWGGLGALGLTVLCGCWFVWRGRWGIVPIGLSGILLIVAYTPFLTRMPLFCLVAPGFAFGPLVVFGTYYAVGGALNASLIYWVCIIPFFLVNNLLLLNQVPDIQADASVGRVTMPIRFGGTIIRRVLAAFYMGAFFVVGLSVLLEDIPYWAFCTFGLIVPAVSVLRTVKRYYENPSVLDASGIKCDHIAREQEHDESAPQGSDLPVGPVPVERPRRESSRLLNKRRTLNDSTLSQMRPVVSLEPALRNNVLVCLLVPLVLGIILFLK